jgi:hypothetical protein
VEKFYRLCKVLCQVATLYVEAKAQGQEQHDHDTFSIGNDFDMYLSQLGFLPSGQHNLSDEMAIPGSNAALHQSSTQLENWFSGKSYTMGLTEEDHSDFDTGLNSS